jgi:hypothetical protein
LKGRYLIYIVLSLGLIIFCALWVLSESKNKTYEDYLSRVIADKAAIISSLPTYTSEMIEVVLENGTISKSQANELMKSFWELYLEIQDLEGFAIQLGELEKDNVSNHAQSVVYEFHSYMINLQASIDKEEILLTGQQKNDLDHMKKQLQSYSMAVTDQFKFAISVMDHPVGYYQSYLDLGVTNDYWVMLLESYEEVTIIN